MFLAMLANIGGQTKKEHETHNNAYKYPPGKYVLLVCFERALHENDIHS